MTSLTRPLVLDPPICWTGLDHSGMWYSSGRQPVAVIAGLRRQWHLHAICLLLRLKPAPEKTLQLKNHFTECKYMCGFKNK